MSLVVHSSVFKHYRAKRESIARHQQHIEKTEHRHIDFETALVDWMLRTTRDMASKTGKLIRGSRQGEQAPLESHTSLAKRPRLEPQKTPAPLRGTGVEIGIAWFLFRSQALTILAGRWSMVSTSRATQFFDRRRINAKRGPVGGAVQAGGGASGQQPCVDG